MEIREGREKGRKRFGKGREGERRIKVTVGGGHTHVCTVHAHTCTCVVYAHIVYMHVYPCYTLCHTTCAFDPSTYFDEFLHQIPVHAVPGSRDVTVAITSRLTRGRCENERERGREERRGSRERQGNTCSRWRGRVSSENAPSLQQ